jgi:drug/metabolite transporter (DMT)-like permease
MQQKSKVRTEIILLGVVVNWGYTFPVVKNVLQDIPPFTFLTYRFFLSFSIIYFQRNRSLALFFHIFCWEKQLLFLESLVGWRFFQECSLPKLKN